MQKPLLKKGIAVAIILLFLSVSVVPSTGTTIEKTSSSFNSNTLFVGGSGPGNYTRIQDAIDNASDGDTVFVYNGTYVENIVINKKMNLVGEDRFNTTIDGNMEREYVVKVLCDSVYISGFKIINAGDGIQIYSYDNTIIKNNLTMNIWFGVAIYGGCDNIICDNVIRNNCGGVLLHSHSQNNHILENKIIENLGGYISTGVELYDSSHNEIIGNLISGSTVNVFLTDSCENTVSNNLIENARQKGIYIFFMSHHNIISNNTFINTSWGIQIEANGNKIIYNNFINNIGHAHFTVFNPFFVPRFNYNKWDRNYWDNWIGLTNPSFSKFPKIIFGAFIRSRIPISWLQFDWHPAKEPYDIGV
ncbi:MAG: right-handed parallel beta-helix repeat-containing protein [Thermoplasmatales archaeon]|nr:MAG: right-handed parallel beta-helix repeat-containing protein [Thermoplasmatales archaeon]